MIGSTRWCVPGSWEPRWTSLPVRVDGAGRLVGAHQGPDGVRRVLARADYVVIGVGGMDQLPASVPTWLA